MNYIVIENSRELLFISIKPSIKIFHTEPLFFTKANIRFEENTIYSHYVEKDNFLIKIKLGIINLEKKNEDGKAIGVGNIIDTNINTNRNKEIETEENQNSKN